MTTLDWTNVTLQAAQLGPENSLPAVEGLFNSQQKQRSSLDEWDGLFLGHGFEKTPFPYRIQDGYARTLAPQQVKAAVLENDYLKAVFLPEYGGRMWSLYDKKAGRMLTYENTALRFGNLAVRNAWFAGGVEWNCGVVGHHPFTCAPVFAAQTQLEDGTPVLRMYQFERIRRAVYQMDFFLPEHSPLLYARMRITNPGSETVPMYWWSNIAVPSCKKGRVVTPATEAYTSEADLVYKVPVPQHQGQDITYPENSDHAVDYFWRIDEGRRKYEGYFDEEGYGLVQASTGRLRGRKLFVWGESKGGARWQQYLAGPGSEGCYVEIQAGLAPTQYECLPMPPQSAWEWLEVYGALQGDKEKVQGSWDAAQAEVEEKLDALVPAARLEELLRETRPMALAKAETLFYACGWGALENLRRQVQQQPPLAQHLDFGQVGEQQAPWVRLLQQGSFGTQEGSALPESWMRQPEWVALMEKAVQGKDAKNAFAWLQYGMAKLADGAWREAQEALEASAALQETPGALFGLSCVASGKGESAQAAGYRLRACAMCPQDISLAQATMKLLLETGQYQEAGSFFSKLPPVVAGNARVRFYHAWVQLRLGSDAFVQELFAPESGYEMPDLREGENSLWQLWDEWQAAREAAGQPRSELPQAFDFRMYAVQSV